MSAQIGGIPSATVIVGNSAGVGVPVAISGDLTITNAGVVTITAATGTFTVGGNVILGSNWISGDGGNEGIRVDASGLVGIGAAPSTRSLLIGGSATPAVRFSASGGAIYDFGPVNATLGHFQLQRVDTANINSLMWLVGRGTGISFGGKGIAGTLGVTGTDAIADSTNYEALFIEAWNLNGYGIFSSKAGSGSARQITIDATGAARASMNQIHLNTSGNVGIGTTTTGSKLTVSGDCSVTDNPYAAGWNGSSNVPTKNAVYDKIEALSAQLEDHFADGASVSTDGTEDDLYTYTIAAGKLNADGAKIAAYYFVSTVSSATATRRIKIYFGGTVIWDSTALTLSVGSSFSFYAEVIRESSSVVRCMVSVTSTSASTVPYSVYTRITGLTLANTQIIKVTGIAAGVGAAGADIVAKLGNVAFKPAAP